MNYVKTQFGNIHINDIPVIVPESTGSKLSSAFAFFSIIMIILIVLMYIVEWVPNNDKKERIVVASFTNKMPTTIKASLIDVYDTDLNLENIVLITSDNNVINIDILQDKYVKIAKNDGEVMFTLDFKAELEIKEIILISPDDPDLYMSHVNIDLYNNIGDDGSKVWEYSAFMPHLRENSVLISKQVFKPGDWAADKLDDYSDMTKKIIMNETQLSLILTETDENYTSY